MKLIIVITLAMATILSLVPVINAYGQGEQFRDQVMKAKERAKEIKKYLDKKYGYLENDPEISAKRDKYNQTYYDCLNTVDALMLAFYGESVGERDHERQQSIEDCRYFYNETGVWVGANLDINNYTSDPKYDIAREKLSDIRAKDEILENKIRVQRNNTIFDKLEDFFIR